MRSNIGRPSAVIVFRIFWPSWALRDLPGEATRFEFGADDTLLTGPRCFYPAAPVVPSVAVGLAM